MMNDFVSFADLPEKFKIAVSFPGESRKEVDEFVAALIKSHSFAANEIFYDYNYQKELASPKLFDKLRHIYLNAETVIVFTSEHYYNKKWTNAEKTTLVERMFNQNMVEDSLIIVKLDNSVIDFLPCIFGYIDGTTIKMEVLATKIAEKIKNSSEITSLMKYDNIQNLACCFENLYSDFAYLLTKKYQDSLISKKKYLEIKLYEFIIKKPITSCNEVITFTLYPMGLDSLAIKFNCIDCTRNVPPKSAQFYDVMISYSKNKWETIVFNKMEVKDFSSYKDMVYYLFNNVILSNIGEGCVCLC